MGARKRDGIDKLIKEALRQELESVTPPPAGPVWERIGSRLASGAPPVPARRPLFWQRWATLAACLLVLFVGGFSYWWWSLGQGRHGDELRATADDLLGGRPEAAADTEKGGTWDGGRDYPAYDPADEGWRPAGDSAEESGLPPGGWPLVIGERFRLGAVYAREGVDTACRAALYADGRGNILLWIRGLEPPERFAGEAFWPELGISVRWLPAEQDSYPFVDSSGLPGLAWPGEEGCQVLVVRAGDLQAGALSALKPALP